MQFDYGKGPSKDQWAKHSELLNTGFQGWDVQQRLPIILKAEIPWMRELTVGFASREKTADWFSRGWFPMRSEHFGETGLTNFNNTVGLRFNLHSVDGVVRHKKSVIMLKRRDDRDAQENAQNDSFEKYFSSISKQSYTHPRDPRAKEMAKYSSAGLEEDMYVRDPGSSVAKKQVHRSSKKEAEAPAPSD